MAQKIVNMRIFEDDNHKMDYSLKDKDYSVLCISNFTLCASTDSGRRPSFEQAMPKDKAQKIFNKFVEKIKALGINVETGAFGKYMRISLDFDGPVNIII